MIMAESVMMAVAILRLRRVIFNDELHNCIMNHLTRPSAHSSKPRMRAYLCAPQCILEFVRVCSAAGCNNRRRRRTTGKRENARVDPGMEKRYGVPVDFADTSS
jgi:hypothetical protein